MKQQIKENRNERKWQKNIILLDSWAFVHYLQEESNWESQISSYLNVEHWDTQEPNGAGLWQGKISKRNLDIVSYK